METVGDLDGFRGTLRNARGIGVSAIPRHDADFGMGLEPGRYGVRLAILEDVDGTAALEINHDRAIAVPFAPGPIVHADHVRLGTLRIGQNSHPPEQRRATE